MDALFFIDKVGDTAGDGGSSVAAVYYGNTSDVTPQKEEEPQSVSDEESDEQVEDEDEDDDDDYGGLPPPSQSISEILNADVLAIVHQGSLQRKSTVVPPAGRNTRRKISLNDELSRTNVENEMKSAVLKPGIERKEDIARLAMSDESLRKLNRLERKKTKGKNWFDLPAPEITPELRHDLQLLKMRSVLDPKQAFKRLEKRKLPKFFEVGKVIASPQDHFSERGAKQPKSKSLVDELLADAQFQKFNKRKYAESLEKQKKKAYHKAVMKMKRDKKNKKKK